MITIMIAGTAPPEHAENLINQIHSLLAETENVALLTSTDTHTHRIIAQYAKGEKIPCFKMEAYSRQRQIRHLAGIDRETGELDHSSAPLILINPTRSLHQIRDTREKHLAQKTAVIFTQKDQPETRSAPMIIKLAGRKAKRTRLNQRRPRR